MAVFPLVCYAVHGQSPLLSGLMLDNGLALLAAQVHQEGHTPIILDYNNLKTIQGIAAHGKDRFLERTIDELSALVKDQDVKRVGFKLYANGFADSLRIADGLKKRVPYLQLFAGGPQVSWFGSTIFEYANVVHKSDVFDAMISGEGDIAIKRIVQGEPFERIPGAFFRDEDGKIHETKDEHVGDLDAMPFPIYHPQVYRDLTSKLLIPVIEDSRNCDWRKCTFCIHPRIGGKFRQRSVESLVDEVAHNRENYGTSVFRLGGPDPIPSLVTALAQRLPDGSRFSAFGRADGEGYDVDLLAKKMVGGLFIGLESADPQVLRDMHKTDDPATYLARAEGLIERFKAHGLPTVASCIVPTANDTQESMRRTLEFLLKVKPDFAPCLPMMPMPGTPLTRKGEAAGVRIEEGYALKVMQYELDLLKPPTEWAAPPWKLRVDGEFVDNPFVINAKFTSELAKHGIAPLSDEIVLMAAIYHGGLSKDQSIRRKQCHDFNTSVRTAMKGGDMPTLYRLVDTINQNVCKGDYAVK